MIDALRPGGWLLLEENDFFPFYTSTSQLYIDFMITFVENVVRPAGGNAYLGRALPAMLAEMGLQRVSGEGAFAVLQGGSPVAEFYSLSAEQIRERIIESGELTAHSGDCDQPFRPKVITDSGDRDHASTPSIVSARGCRRSAPSTRVQVA